MPTQSRRHGTHNREKGVSHQPDGRAGARAATHSDAKPSAWHPKSREGILAPAGRPREGAGRYMGRETLLSAAARLYSSGTRPGRPREGAGRYKGRKTLLSAAARLYSSGTRPLRPREGAGRYTCRRKAVGMAFVSSFRRNWRVRFESPLAGARGSVAGTRRTPSYGAKDGVWVRPSSRMSAMRGQARPSP